MRKLLFLLAIGAMILCAQEPPAGGGRGRGPAAPPKNLKVLAPDNFMANMRLATAGLGVQCTFCHEQDRSADTKPEKVTARMMFQMVMDINSKMPADAKVKVTCYTCHRGMETPVSAPPAQ
jgi:hypothetical protein